MSNPFRVHGVVDEAHFANREAEVRRIADALVTPPTKLLLFGERRMGKSSALAIAAKKAQSAGGTVIIADLSTASTVVDMTNRVLEAAGKALGRTWPEIARELIRSMGVSLTMRDDPLTGTIVPSVDVRMRKDPVDEQRQTLGRVLDTLNQMAGRRRRVLGIVLDEFQEIHRFGGEQAEWHLRGIIQHHQHVAYVLAGSQPRLIRRMLGKKRAFYGMLDKMEFGPIDRDYMARWIDERITDTGRLCRDVGVACANIAGPRTRDVVQLARKTYDMTGDAREAANSDVERAFLEILHEEDGPIRAWWNDLTAVQQNVIRAVSAAPAGLTTGAITARFSLASSSAVTQALGKFVNDGDALRGGPSGYILDNPYVRGWVVTKTLPDLGIHLPPTFRPDEPYPA